VNPIEPQPEQIPVGDPPEHLQGHARLEWERAGKVLRNQGMFTKADLKVFESYCVAYGHWRDAEEALARARAADLVNYGLVIETSSGRTVENPLVGTARRYSLDMLRYASEFGFTPASRTCVVKGSLVKANKFGNLLDDAGGPQSA
jgi:P27 family predicted phage terminase small subunit